MSRQDFHQNGSSDDTFCVSGPTTPARWRGPPRWPVPGPPPPSSVRLAPSPHARRRGPHSGDVTPTRASLLLPLRGRDVRAAPGAALASSVSPGPRVSVHTPTSSPRAQHLLPRDCDRWPAGGAELPSGPLTCSSHWLLVAP